MLSQEHCLKSFFRALTLKQSDNLPQPIDLKQMSKVESSNRETEIKLRLVKLTKSRCCEHSWQEQKNKL